MTNKKKVPTGIRKVSHRFFQKIKIKYKSTVLPRKHLCLYLKVYCISDVVKNGFADVKMSNFNFCYGTKDKHLAGSRG